jgi:hypothetical protein
MSKNCPPPQVPGAAVYGLTKPTVSDVRGTLRTVYRRGDERAWTRLLERAGIKRPDDDPAAVERLIKAACASDDRVLALCGRAQHLRLTAYERLAAVRDLVSATG